MEHGASLLRRVIDDKFGGKQVAFAAAAQLPEPQVSAYLDRARKPGRINALKIETTARAAGVEIPPESWDVEEPRPGRTTGKPRRPRRPSQQ